MDEIAIREIEQALKRARARIRKTSIVCICGGDLEVFGRYGKCWRCGERYQLRPQKTDLF